MLDVHDKSLNSTPGTNIALYVNLLGFELKLGWGGAITTLYIRRENKVHSLFQ